MQTDTEFNHSVNDDIEIAAAQAAPEPLIEAFTSGGRELLLSHPIKVDGNILQKIRVRVPSQGDIDDWGAGHLPTVRDFLVRLTNTHPLVIKALSWPDSEALHMLFRDVVPAFVIPQNQPEEE